MDPFTFISSIIKSIAWPVVVIVVFFVFRKPIINLVSTLIHLIPAIRSFRVKNFEIAISEKVSNLPMVTYKNLPLQIEEKQGNDQIKESIFERSKILMEISPYFAMIDAWRELQISSLLALKKVNPKLANLSSRTQFSKLLKANNLLDSAQADTFEKIEDIYKLALQNIDFKIDENVVKNLVHDLLNAAESLSKP